MNESGFFGSGIGPRTIARRRSSEWWTVAGQTCVAAYQPKGATSLAASYVNLANPGDYNAAPGVAPGWTPADGWIFNGTSGYLLTGIALNSGYTIIVRFSVDSAGETAGRLWDTTASNTYVIPNNGDVNFATKLGGSTSMSIAPALYGPQIIGVAGATVYVNGVSVGTVSENAPEGNIILGNRAADDRTLAGKIYAAAIYSTTISAPDVAALTTRMAAL